MTRRLWWCGLSSVLAALLVGGCYNPSNFRGDGTMAAGAAMDAFRYRVECRDVDLGQGGITRLRLTGVPTGEFEFAFEGDEILIQRIAGHDRWTIGLFFCEHDQPASNVAGGRMVEEHWTAGGTVGPGLWRLSPRRWNPGMPATASGRSYDVVIEVKGEAIAGEAKVTPVLEWKR